MLRQVKTENGWVRGIEAADPRITAFKGIPFAAPPIGKNRWRAPQPCGSWAGVRDASRFAPISMQWIPGLSDDIYVREWHVDPEIPMGEDCLYLNVWTPAKKAEEKLPVLVWYFGGGLQCGYPAEMEFDGERIARRGIVVVTVNYRVGALGFLTHPELTKEQPEAPANFGNLDQQAGLKWVRRNIAAFGGDPAKVTIAGQSAGGGSVMSQTACPDNTGLFRGAVVMSAMIFDPYLRREIGRPEKLADAEKKGEEFFAFLGVKNLKEARALDAVTLQRRYEKYMESHVPFFTVQDDLFCTGDPIGLYREGKCVDVPGEPGEDGGRRLRRGQRDRVHGQGPADGRREERTEGLVLLLRSGHARLGQPRHLPFIGPVVLVRDACQVLAPLRRAALRPGAADVRLFLQLHQNRRSEREGSERGDAPAVGAVDGGDPVHDALPGGRGAAGNGAAAAAETVPF